MGQRPTTGATIDENIGLPSKCVSVQRLAPLLKLRRSALQVGHRATTDVALDENFSLPSKFVSVQRLALLLTKISVCPASVSAYTDWRRS